MSNFCHCLKPFNTIVISSDGNVYCCGLQFSFTQIGNIYRESIREIWRCKKINDLRKSVIRHSLYPECSHCLHRIEGEIPSIISIDNLFLRITHSCNLNCVFCDLSQVHDKPDDFRLLDEIKTVLPNLKLLNITGGEPLIRKRKIVFLLNNLLEVNPNCEIVLRTNGTVSSREIFNILKKFKRVRIIVSLDAFSEEVFINLKRKNKFKVTVANILKMLAMGFKVEAQYLITSINYFQVADFILWAKKNGTPYFCRLLTSPIHYSLFNKKNIIEKENALNLFYDNKALLGDELYESLYNNIKYST